MIIILTYCKHYKIITSCFELVNYHQLIFILQKMLVFDILLYGERFMKKCTMGIVAHVDSGKTTLSEAMLFISGAIRKKGRVDHGDAFLDTDTIEKERGITIFSKQAVFEYGNTCFTLLDTPGHVDFSAETERTFKVLDAAVLVISGTDGVQNHTETLWKLLCEYEIPVFIFVNKTDISDKSQSEIMESLKSRLNINCVNFCDSSFEEEVAMCEDSLTESYINGTLTSSEIALQIKNRNVFPCFFGSALKGDGVEELMKGLDEYSVNPKTVKSFGARVFKISEGALGERLTHLKITGGKLCVKDVICGKSIQGEEKSEKVNSLRIYSGEKFTAISEAECGSVVAVTGLTFTYAGQGLGFEEDFAAFRLEPVLTYGAKLPDGANASEVLKNLKKLEEEDPQLKVSWDEAYREVSLHIMGEVQLEVITRIISERFGLNLTFGQGSISYKETIEEAVIGYGHYEPLRHYSEVHLLLEPLPRGSGLVFDTDCSEDVLDRNWQRLILTHLAEKEHIGVLTGSPITDMKITLIAGRAHIKHTEGGDFRQATYRAVRQGLKSAKSVLLEPWYDFTLEVPAEYTGRAMTDIQYMGGEFFAPETGEEVTVISGSAPVSKMRDYHTEVTGYTRGCGRLSCRSGGYRECHNADEVIQSIGYDSDADTENTADSVFCSHGAGFTVKWNFVHEYIHIDSSMPEEKEDEEIRVKSYISRMANDDELMAIFEKTYGPVVRTRYNMLETEKGTPKPKKEKPYKPVAPKKEYLLIDGYNVIFAWEDLKKQASDSLDYARVTLINRMCSYRAVKNCEVILVFDAYKVKGNVREVEKIHDVSVVYTKEAETADMYIEKATKELGKKNRVRVVTSDNLEQLIILGSGAIRVSADGFKKELEQTEKQIREMIDREF